VFDELICNIRVKNKRRTQLFENCVSVKKIDFPLLLWQIKTEQKQ